ncbi:hypothetical protein [Microbispora sp. H13382]|uniref:hypothetical protein n=1 Tax=Microbispora sp. H13382 TaxID=2729112 RepID=UPI00160033C7|nr:hypothetical protein [Microbispora sp. H13382]
MNELIAGGNPFRPAISEAEPLNSVAAVEELLRDAPKEPQVVLVITAIPGPKVVLDAVVPVAIAVVRGVVDVTKRIGVRGTGVRADCQPTDQGAGDG